MDFTSTVRSNNGGTRTLLKVADIINNNSHAKRRRKNRNRKVVWFNPPFCKLINIGKYFLQLLDKHFNRDNPLSRIFNRNTVKISYSCTKNMNNILSNHNRLLNELIAKDRSPDVPSRNCKSKEECPLGGRCNSRNVVYQACISPIEHKKKKKKNRRRKNLYRNLRGKLEVKVILSQA